MILSILRIKPLSGKERDVIEILESLKKELCLIDDCLGAEICEAIEPEPSILFLEKWRRKEAFYRHVRSDLYMRVLAVMELASESPEIIFPEALDISGMDLISELREGSRR